MLLCLDGCCFINVYIYILLTVTSISFMCRVSPLTFELEATLKLARFLCRYILFIKIYDLMRSACIRPSTAFTG